MFKLLRPILLIIAILLTITPFIINPPAVSANKTLGNIKIAFFQARFNNSSSFDLRPRADIEATLFAYPPSAIFKISLKSVILEESSSRTVISGRVYDPVTLPYDVDLQRGRCEINRWRDDLKNAIQRQGVNFSDYDYFIYYFPRVENCVRSGSAFAGDNWILSYGNIDPSTWIHELLHTFGLNHSSTYSCGTRSIDNFTNCQNEEYGDYSNIMGHGEGANGISGPHKYQLGWLYDLYQTIDSTGVQNVSVYNLNLNTSTLDNRYLSRVKKIIKIPKYDTGLYYFITYKPQGARIYIAEDTPVVGNPKFRKIRLLNPHPGVDIQEPFRDGDEFVDEINNIKVKQISHNTAYANLRIEMNSSPLPPPQISNVQCGSEQTDSRGKKYIPVTIDGHNLGGYDDLGGINKTSFIINGIPSYGTHKIISWNNSQITAWMYNSSAGAPLICNGTFVFNRGDGQVVERSFDSFATSTPSPSPSPRVTEIKLQHLPSTGRVTEQTISLPRSTFNFSIDPSSHLTRFLFHLSDNTRVSPYYYVKFINQNTSASGGLIINPEIRIDSVLTIN